MLKIRRMRPGDITFGIRLSDQENWGITACDLKRVLTLNPKGCFVAQYGNRRVGLTTTTVYGRRVAWIGNVIVDRAFRGRRIGHGLVEHSLAFLLKSRIQRIALYCFSEHLRFYQSMGFVKDTAFLRLQRKAQPADRVPSPSTAEHGLTLKQLLMADRKAFGADRSKLIRNVLTTGAGRYLGTSEGAQRTTYLMIRQYSDLCEFGPWVCLDPNRTEPQKMLRNALALISKVPVEVSCLQKNRSPLALLERESFRVVRNGFRMLFEERADLGDDRAQYALGFLDKG
jgi:GNAT superfamily N-acetyltransferase